MKTAPLGAIRAFEATARLASFKSAASELNVTPTAVSHQIKLLETALGIRLLERTPRQVLLTAPGRELFNVARTALESLDLAFYRLRTGGHPRTLTLSATAAFLSAWLVPRLAQMQTILGPVELRLHASDQVVELKEGFIDIAIRYGHKPKAAIASRPLGADDFVPVLSPRLAPVVFGSATLPPLIHLEGSIATLPLPDWRSWFKTAGLPSPPMRAGLKVTSSLHAIQAAIAGQGMALVSRVLARDALTAGLLVRPHAHVTQGANYYYVCAQTLATDELVSRLGEWFKNAFDAGHDERGSRRTHRTKKAK